MEKIYKADPNLVVKPAYYSDGVPVFEPTMEEFKDFYKYNKAINPYGMQSGIVKVVPPPEWTSLLRGTYTEENLLQIKIRNPIVQNINVTAGYPGVFSLQNVERQRSYNIYQWKELLKKSSQCPPLRRKSRGRGSNLPSSSTNEESNGVNETKTDCKSTRTIADELLDADFNIDVSEFTPERCKELESVYWKSVGYSEPMYGADMLGSLFLERTTSWNVAHLPNVLDLMEETIPGVNDAYLYAGLWKATFSWHLEDQDLYSINYLHFGAPKQWYSIPQNQHRKFYNLMKDIFNEDYKNCHEFLRHKTFMASPQFLQKNGIQCNSIVHHQGEFMITYPYGYHSGFNLGYNLAESVNFALDDWFPFAEKTHKCECISDSVGINHKQIYCKFKGIPYVPESVDDREEMEKPKELIKSSSLPSVPSVKKQPRKREKKDRPKNQCVLCPNSLPETLLRYKNFELLVVEDTTGPETKRVHRICAEQFGDQLKILGGKVKGMNTISKPQRGLKCQVCHLPAKPQDHIMGACFQCSHAKCTKSFHATCAISGGVSLDAARCKQHRSETSPYYEKGSPELHKKVESIRPDSLVQFTLTNHTRKRHTGDVYAGVVQSNNRKEGTLELLVYPNLEDRLELQYDDILLGKNTVLDNSNLLSMPKKRGSVSKSKPIARKRMRSSDDTDELLAGPVSPIEHEMGLSPSFGHYTPPIFNAVYQSLPQKSPQIVFINQTSQHTHNPLAEHRGLRFVEETFNDH